MNRPEIVIRGAGELASGVAHRLFVCGFRPVMLELPEPRMVRRIVCFGEAVYAGEWTVEGVLAKKVTFPFNAHEDYIPVVIDPEGALITQVRPHILIDARMKKRDVDLSIEDAPLVIGIGPGIEVGTHAHVVVETQRGHFIGKVYRQGRAIPNTGIPGDIAGKTIQRLLRAPEEGVLHTILAIGARVQEGISIARVGDQVISAPFDGVLRGLLKDGLHVSKGEKVGDVDPRPDIEINTISDKARAVSGGVLEAIFSSIPWTMDVVKGNSQRKFHSERE